MADKSKKPHVSQHKWVLSVHNNRKPKYRRVVEGNALETKWLATSKFLRQPGEEYKPEAL